MAVGNVQVERDLSSAPYSTPVSTVSKWQDICTAPATYDGSSNGSDVVTPGGITRSAQNWLNIDGQGTTVLLRLQYKRTATVTTAPVIQVFGRDRHPTRHGAATPYYHRLKDASQAFSLTLSVASTDHDDGNDFKHTEPVEVDADACQAIMATIKTALAADDTTGATIQAKVK